MSTEHRDPIFESLDRLAGMADADMVGDRMPGIQRRVRVARRRKGAGIVAAAAVVAVGGVGVWQALPSERTVPPATTPTTVVETTVVETTVAPGFTTADRLKADIDGDGTDDVIEVLVPKDVTQDQLIQVTRGTGETATQILPNTMTWLLLEPVDLDTDGDLELIVQGGGGEVAEGLVFLADPENLERVKTVDAAGKPLPLRSTAYPADWQTYFGPDGVYSYRLTDPAATSFPAPVEVREWSLVGTGLIQSDVTLSQCVSFQPTTVLGPC